MKKFKLFCCFCFGIILSVNIIHAQKPAFNEFLDLDSIFGKNEGTFVMYHQAKNTFYIYKPLNANILYPVHSTSKIIWSAMALENGIVKDENEIMVWDSLEYPRTDFWPESWTKDQTIVTALNRSVNWYYIELLKKTKPEELQAFLDTTGYAYNYTVKSNYYFALSHTIKNSAFDQIYFLIKLQNRTLPVSETTFDIIRKGMLLEKTDNYSIYFRTGLGPVDDTINVGWYIGYIEKDKDVYFFAFNVIHEDEMVTMQLRNDYIFRILKAINILP